jgi:RNA polymerase sigma-70 factor (ECF subfamily)
MTLDRARTGDASAFDAIVETHTPALYRLAYRLTGNAQDAEDVVQETFVRAYTRLDEYAGEEHLEAWLRRATANRAVDLLRRRARWREAGGETIDHLGSSSPGPERGALDGEVRGRVAETLEELSPRERVAFLLRHVEGRSIAEIGQVLGTGTSATKNHIFRAVRKMRQALEPLLEGAK